MRRLFILLALSFVVLSCSKDEYTSNGFTFDRQIYEVGYEGGTVTIHFSMEGQRVIPELRCYSEWVSLQSVATSTVTIAVDKNFGKSREAELKFVNPRNGSEADIVIRQGAYGGKRMIDVSVSDITTRCCTARAKATNKDMLLVSFMDDNEYIDEDIEFWELIVSSIVHMHKLAAAKQDMPFVDYLVENNLGGYGSLESHFDDLLPGHMMNFGAFGISYDEASGDFELLTPIYYKSFYCEVPDRRDITLSSDLKVDGADVAITIDPGSWDGYYAYNIVSKVRSDSYFPPTTTIDDELHLEWSKNWYAEFQHNVVNSGMALEEFLNLYCLKGRVTFDTTLYALEDYLFVAYAIDMVEGAPQVVSPLHYKHFTTEEVGRSDLAVEVEFKEVYGRMARFDILPSNDEDSYVAGVRTKEEVDVVPESTIIGSLTSSIDPINGVRYGKQSAEVCFLQPDTEYVVCVVGTHGNMITTDLMCFEFTTGAEEPCAVAVESITIGGPYSLHDLYEYDSSYVHPSYLEQPEFMVGVCWYEIETQGEPYKIYSGLIETRQFENFYEEDIYAMLMYRPSTTLETYFVSYDQEMVVLCCLMDQRGNTSEIYRSETVLMRMEDNRDPSELAAVLDRIAEGTRAGSDIIDYINTSVVVDTCNEWLPIEYAN